MSNINEPGIATNRQPNRSPWWGLLLAIAALAINGLFFLKTPGIHALPWISLFLAALALVFVIYGVRLAYGHGTLYRGKISSVVIGVLAVAVCAVAALAFVKSKGLPDAAGAPQVGERAPDFSLPDS